MRQVFPLEQDADAEALGQPRAFGDRRGTAPVVAEDPVQLGAEGRVTPGVVEPLLQLQAVLVRMSHDAVAVPAHVSLQS